MPICAINTENGPCAKPSGHNGKCDSIASYQGLLTGLEDHKPIYDKIHRSPKDTAGKDPNCTTASKRFLNSGEKVRSTAAPIL